MLRTKLRVEAAGLRDDGLPSVVDGRSIPGKGDGRRHRLADEMRGAIALLVLGAVLLLLTLAIIRVEYRQLTEGRPTATESEALSNVLYGRQR
jgi:hypothetical protein